VLIAQLVNPLADLIRLLVRCVCLEPMPVQRQLFNAVPALAASTHQEWALLRVCPANRANSLVARMR